jgi:hypothetical protein
MQVRNLFEPGVKEEVIERIKKLTAQSQPLWGKMNVAQMLAHLQQPIGVAQGVYNPRRTLFGRVVGPMVKAMYYNEKPFKRNLPTDPSFVMTSSEKDFEKERQNLINMIRTFNEASIVNETHTFFGKLTREQWSKGTWKHLDHHLQQFGV